MITLALRQLLRFVREYPRQPLLAAVEEASRYGLYDLDRLERMILGSLWTPWETARRRAASPGANW